MMKNIVKLQVLLLILTGLGSCNNDDDNTPTNPIDQLPPATQIGANTAGCLVDGKAIFPKGNNFIYNLYYTDGLNFGLFFKHEESGIDRTINIASLNEKLVVGEVYELNEVDSNSKYGEYSTQDFPSREKRYQTNLNSTGELKITFHDFDNAIISGIFWFDAINDDGEVIKVREGRFDGKY